jgi:hypothetical protein
MFLPDPQDDREREMLRLLLWCGVPIETIAVYMDRPDIQRIVSRLQRQMQQPAGWNTRSVFAKAITPAGFAVAATANAIAATRFSQH